MAKIDQTSASRAVLIEVSNVLGAFREHLVIVGGWVPELLFPNRGHIGSLDVDLAISSLALTDNAYETIMKRLTEAGYTHRIDPTRFTKNVAGASEPVKVDLISGQYHHGKKVKTIQVNELQIDCLSGVDLAFTAFDEIEVPGTMPDGTANKVRIRIVRPEAFILIKAFALNERIKEKDAYDVSFVLRHYQPSLASLAKKLNELLQHPLAREGYEILQAKFAGIDSVGPVWAARVYQEQAQDYEQARRAAFEDAQELFRIVNSDS